LPGFGNKDGNEKREYNWFNVPNVVLPFQKAPALDEQEKQHKNKFALLS